MISSCPTVSLILTMRFGLFRNFDTAGEFVMKCGSYVTSC